MYATGKRRSKRPSSALGDNSELAERSDGVQHEGPRMPYDARLRPRPDVSESLVQHDRNEAAQHRALAIRLLVERGSPLALQPDIVEEARALKLKDPAVLLPGVIDIFADRLDIDA
jgi:hypothetical protein